GNRPHPRGRTVTEARMTDAKVAIVTGAGRGIGLGIAHCLARAGYAVCVWDSNAANIESAVASLREMGARAHGVACDVADHTAIERAVDETRGALGVPTMLVNNAATRHRARLEHLRPEDWDHEVAVNLSGVFYCTQAVGRLMLLAGHGSIVNIA